MKKNKGASDKARSKKRLREKMAAQTIVVHHRKKEREKEIQLLRDRTDKEVRRRTAIGRNEKVRLRKAFERTQAALGF